MAGQPLEEDRLIAIRDSIERGQMRDPHILSLLDRQQIIEKILMHGTIDQPNCATILSSPEFLQGFTSIHIQCSDNQPRRRYLEMLTDSMTQACPDGRILGSRITALTLNFFTGGRCLPMEEEFQNQEAILETVARLISRCPNLKSLKVVASLGREYLPGEKVVVETSPHFEINVCPWYNVFGRLLKKLDVFESGSSIIENLEQLAVIGGRKSDYYSPAGETHQELVINQRPMLKFKNLSSVTMIDFNIDPGVWNKLLQKNRDTLVRLEMTFERRAYYINGYSEILPFPLPRLEWLKISSESEMLECDRRFVDNLMQSPALKYGFLTIGGRQRDAAALERLAQISNLHVRAQSTSANIKLEIDVRLDDEDDDFGFGADPRCELIGPDSRFTVVRIFGDHIVSFRLTTSGWNQRMTAAFKDVIDKCKNLKSFSFDILTNRGFVEWKRAEFYLRELLFDNPERALKLENLHVKKEAFGRFEFDVETFSSIFENCLNLKSVAIEACSQLYDAHLIHFGSRGGKLRSLSLVYCKNINDAGPVAIFQTSGEQLVDFQLERFHVGSKIMNRMWQEFFAHCLYAKRVFFNNVIPPRRQDLDRCQYDLREITENFFLH